MKTSKSNLRFLGILTLGTALLLAGCTGGDTPPSLEDRVAANQPELEYDLKDVEAEVTQGTEELGFTASQLASRASSCGNDQEKEHFEALVKQFEEARAERFFYNFKYSGETQGTGTYRVFLMKNVAGYKNLDEFKTDFDLCNAGGFDYPTDLNKDWLLFVGSCRKIGNDTSKADGCAEIRDALEGTFEIK